MHKPSIPQVLLGLFALVFASGCGGEDAEDGPHRVSLAFSANVGAEPFSCSKPLPNLGVKKSTAEALDMRMYIHDVTLLRADGTEARVELDQDGQWQRENLAFLDFEDGTGTCETGSPETRTVVTGKVPAGDYTGVSFSVGVPAEMNHLDAATAPAPLNVPGMWWSWKGGYKFVRLELKTAANPTYFFHLGSTSCQGTVNDGFSCAASNQAKIRLDSFNPEGDTIVFDVAQLLAGSDLDLQVDPMTDVSGCMSFAGDPECPAIFGALGMPFEGQDPGNGKQTAFRVE